MNTRYVVKWKPVDRDIWLSQAIEFENDKQHAIHCANIVKQYHHEVVLQEITYTETIVEIDLGE